MWWQYLLVFLGAFLVDVVPIPLPPAFTVMLLFYMMFDLNIWVVLIVGVVASIAGRWVLTLYIPHVSEKLFNKAKGEDIEFLGNKMKQKGWKGQLFILAYSLLPLPTTPLFLAGGMARLSPLFLIPPFTIGKIISDFLAVQLGSVAVESTSGILEGMLTWKSIGGLFIGLAMIFTLLFMDWKTLFLHKKFQWKFNIWQSQSGPRKTNRKKSK